MVLFIYILAPDAYTGFFFIKDGFHFLGEGGGGECQKYFHLGQIYLVPLLFFFISATGAISKSITRGRTHVGVCPLYPPRKLFKSGAEIYNSEFHQGHIPHLFYIIMGICSSYTPTLYLPLFSTKDKPVDLKNTQPPLYLLKCKTYDKNE